MKCCRRFLFAATILLIGQETGSAIAQAVCQEADKPGWISGGLLMQRAFKDAAGRTETAYILEMPQAECLRGNGKSDNVRPTRTIQIYSSDGAIEEKIHRFVDKRVMIEGRAFGATAAHHHAPIVVDLSSIAPP